MSEIVTVTVVMGKGWEDLRRETLRINSEEIMHQTENL